MKRGFLGLLTIAMASVLGIVLMSGPASAAQQCTYTADYNACLFITRQSTGDYLVRFGIDLRKLSKKEAQTIIDAPGHPFYANLIGSDFKDEDFIGQISTTRVWASTESGLSGEGARVFSRSALNEDPEGCDELYARIAFIDPRTGASRGWTTPQIALCI